MSIPEATSAEAFESYVGGKCLVVGQGEAWRDIKAWIVALPPVVDTLYLPILFPGGEVDVDTPDDFTRLTAEDAEQEKA